MQLRTRLTASDKQNLWQKFKYSRSRNAPDQAQNQWKRLEGLNKGEGKQEAKNEFLWAWVESGQEWSGALLEEWTTLTQGQKQGADVRWISKGRLEMMVGKEEASELIEEGSIKSKPNPDRPGKLLYQYNEELC
eukprot:9074392-Alexandrium_andersonii.AAC.1